MVEWAQGYDRTAPGRQYGHKAMIGQHQDGSAGTRPRQDGTRTGTKLRLIHDKQHMDGSAGTRLRLTRDGGWHQDGCAGTRMRLNSDEQHQDGRTGTMLRLGS